MDRRSFLRGGVAVAALLAVPGSAEVLLDQARLQSTFVSDQPVHMLSVFAKRAEDRFFEVAGTCFDLLEGRIMSSGPGVANIADMGNGWYRCSVEMKKLPIQAAAMDFENGRCVYSRFTDGDLLIEESRTNSLAHVYLDNAIWETNI